MPKHLFLFPVALKTGFFQSHHFSRKYFDLRFCVVYANGTQGVEFLDLLLLDNGWHAGLLKIRTLIIRLTHGCGYLQLGLCGHEKQKQLLFCTGHEAQEGCMVHVTLLSVHDIL